ncbi:MAG: hypothetical protein ACI8WB_002175 [Phenylobacterium sp.]|jgi:hypothetical protein
MADNSTRQLKQLLGIARRKLWFETALLLLALSALCWVFASPYLAIVQVLALILPLLLSLLWWRQQHKKLTLNNLVLHLNREFAELEESCQLLLKPVSGLQKLQQQQIQQVLHTLAQNKQLTKSLPPLRYRLSLVLFLSAAIIHFVAGKIDLSIEIIGTEAAITDTVSEPTLLSTTIMVQPPAYTRLPSSSFSEGDIEITEGSTVQWQLKFSAPSTSKRDYQLLLSDEAPIRLKRQANEQGEVWFSASKVINKTALYRIGYDHDKTLAEVYSVSVNRDKPPKVRIVEPDQSLVALAKSAPPRFSAKAMVSDDFGITQVKILASVAKGSGEAVKFRDAEFTFDSKAQQADGRELYSKEWDLIALGMEPGDEVYFTVVANDNKASGSQHGRSGTVIVRWLDDEEQGITAEGVVINFVPEYFRSQRQIIIETEQLIADRADMSTAAFEALSIELGQAQGDLKQRYGQYLGDEFGDGPGDQLDAGGVAGGVVGGVVMDSTEHHDEESHDDEEAGHDEHQSHNAEPGEHSAFSDRSGAAQIIAEFGHAHEAVYVGVVSQQNPKAMMKKAVEIMWDAELHLLMSAPELALPYEREAYKYLKLAKQAERIYVKRLGFVPPPVKESKRLTGELEDIHSRHDQAQAQVDPDDDNALFHRAFTLINGLSSQGKLSPLTRLTPLTTTQREQLGQLKSRFTELAQTRGGLIRHAATLEKVFIANSLTLDNCDNCLTQLSNKLWQLIKSPLSHPVAGQQNFINSDPLIKDYLNKRQARGTAQ